MVHVTIGGSLQDGQEVNEELTDVNLKRPLLAKLNFDNKMKGRQRVPVQHEEDNAVEHDESFYQQVAVEQDSYVHSYNTHSIQGHPSQQ